MPTPYTPPPGATQNAYGYWILPSGDFAPGQDMSRQMGGATPAQAAATGGPVQTDASGKQYRLIDGRKWYLPPMTGLTGAADTGGGLIHGRMQWNPETGQYDTPVDWGKILTMVTAGIITAGAADAALASAPALAATAPAGASASAATAGAGTLAATTTAPLVAALPTGLASGTAAAAPVVAAGGASVIPWSTIIGAGTQLFGNLFAANQASSAADKGAEATAAAAKYSADLTAKANADALKFQYAGAENAFQNNEAARQGNYGIFAARERRLGPIGEEVGLAPREVPAYVPGVDPGFGTMGEAATGTPSTGAPAAGGGDLMTALTNNYKALGVAPTGPGSGPTDIAYMAKQMAATGGMTPANASYWLGPNGRIAAELAKAKAGGQQTTQPAARTAAPATTATPFMPAQVAAGPQAIGYYA